MMALIVATLCASFIFRQITVTLNLHIIDHGYTEAHCGLVQSINGFLIIFVEIPLTALTVWISYRTGVAAGFLMLGLGMAVNWFGGSLWLVCAGMIVLTAGEMLCLPRHSAWVQQLSPADMRGRFTGFIAFAWLGGNLLGSWAGLGLYSTNPDLLWLLCGLMGVIAALVLMSVKSHAVTKSATAVSSSESQIAA
jgi:hypothetical protein